jgi:hypothetical protein
MAVARLCGFSDVDVHLLKSIRHSRWVWRAFLPGSRGLPLARLEMPPRQTVDDDDRALARRLVAYYQLAKSADEESVPRSPMWKRNIAGLQAPLVTALRAKDVEGLSDLLCGFLRSQVVLGIDSGNTYTDRNWRVHSLRLLDGLVSLAEQLGVVATESGEGPQASALAGGAAALVKSIEDALGISIGVPDVGSPYGLRLDDSFVTPSSPEYVHVAWRIREAVDLFLQQPEKLNCSEIGAGYGPTALFLFRLLGSRIARYNLIDLPEIGCLQAYYLGKALGAEMISFQGEEPTGRIRILPPQSLPIDQPSHLVINQNSMPEIPADAAREYIRWIAENCGGIFFSYNHETRVPGGQFAVTTVPEIVAEVGGLKRLTRNMAWPRPGYVEEVYAPSSSSAHTAT